MRALDDILTWSQNRPNWQRDALRRIVVNGSLQDSDVIEVVSLCLAEHGIQEGNAAAADPLASLHLPTSDPSADEVRLLRLFGLKYVNALAPQQEMSFAAEGMTVVFGFNGSGKSGYARVLRAVCHARHQDERILANVFATDEQGKPTAEIEYSVGKDVRSYVWTQGSKPPTELRRVSLFDSECAAVHVNKSNEIVFTPVGLDVLPKLAELCQEVKARLEFRVTRLDREKSPKLTAPSSLASTVAERRVRGLSTETSLDELREFSTLNADENTRLEELDEALQVNPATLVASLRRRSREIGILQRRLQEITTLLGSAALGDLKRVLEDAVAKRQAATAAAEAAFADQPLAGVGERVWQELWAAARRYSQQTAYVDETFPYVGDDARCVLCQQPLQPDAKQRLGSFEAFLAENLESAASESERTLAAKTKLLAELQLNVAAYRSSVSDDRALSRDAQYQIAVLFRVARMLRKRILMAVDRGQWDIAIELPDAPMAQLHETEERLKARIAELADGDIAERRAKLLAERAELQGRVWLSSVIDESAEEVSRLRLQFQLSQAIRSTSTNGITIQSNVLTDRYVTDTLREAFLRELKQLTLGRVQVSLESPGGQYGQKFFRVAVPRTTIDVSPQDILSEGEFRCVALAAFLAELSLETTVSSVVFDDPVSSLDQNWRRRAASRLRGLAEERQVIVFTHDIVFLHELGLGNQEDHRSIYVFRGTYGPGTCLDGVPWEAMKVSARIGILKKRQQEAAAILRNIGQEAYGPVVRELYGLMRETWERAVEEVLFNQVVQRFDIRIQTNMLKAVDVTPADLQAVDQGMTKCSRFLPGHDTPGAAAEPPPPAEEVLQDIVHLESWVASVRKRRK